MSDTRLPPQDPGDPVDELLSAVLDGMASADEEARVAADPQLRARLGTLRALRQSLADVPALPDEVGRTTLAAALVAAANGEAEDREVLEVEDGASAPAAPAPARTGAVPIGVATGRRRERRDRRPGALVGVAAAVVLVLAGLVAGLAALGGDDDNDAASGALGQASASTAAGGATTAAAGGSEDAIALREGDVGAATAPSDAGAADPSTRAALPHLGDVQGRAQLSPLPDAWRDARALDVPATACSQEALAGHPPGTTAVDLGTLTLAGTPAVAVAVVPVGADAPSTALVLAEQGCEVLAEVPWD